MTTNTINRKLLEEVVELFDSAISTRYPHEILRDIRAALADPAPDPDDQLRKDAERYRWLAEYLVSDDESHDDAIVAARTVEELNAVIDGARGTP